MDRSRLRSAVCVVALCYLRLNFTGRTRSQSASPFYDAVTICQKD